MKSKNAIISMLLSIYLILSLCATAFAKTNDFAAQQSTNESGIVVEEIEPIDLSGVDPKNIVGLPQSQNLSLEENASANAVVNDMTAPTISPTLLAVAPNLAGSQAEARAQETPFYQVHTMCGLLTVENPDALYTIYVEAGQILQVELQVPQNLALNYDLYLFEYVEATSAITLVSGSEYITDSNFMPEGVGAINNSGGRMTYLMMVSSNKNPGPTDYYTLNASIANEHDSFEPNENAFFAIDLPEISDTSMLTLTGGLNSPLDNDWFSLNVANTSQFSGLEIQGVPAFAVIESYTVVNGNQLKKTGSTANGMILPISAGYNYFRLLSTRNASFSPSTYAIKVAPALNATKAVFFISVNGYCQRFSDLFNDGRNRRLLLSSADVEVRVLYATDNNIAVRATDTINVSINNPAWTSPVMQYKTGFQSVQNSYTCSVLLNAPTIRGSSYDLVYTTITSQKFGVLADNWEMALMFKYGNQETNSPCIHNGACGFN